jgi:hypothetical protein
MSGTVTDPDGLVWALRCDCGLHPHVGHEAEPVAYVGDAEPIDMVPIVRDAVAKLAKVKRREGDPDAH